MPLWHCPHCGTPQPESARCWVCRKSSTSCATCRHFRNAVAAQLGYCGLDRRRRPLRGDEMRGCWEGATVAPIGIGARTADTIAPFKPSIAWTEVDASRPGRRKAATTGADRAPAIGTARPATSAEAPGPAVAIVATEPVDEVPFAIVPGSLAHGRSPMGAAPAGLWDDIEP